MCKELQKSATLVSRQLRHSLRGFELYVGTRESPRCGNKFLQQEQAVGAISRYNYNNLVSPYRIGPIPKTQWEWQYWNVVNSKLGKHFER